MKFNDLPTWAKGVIAVVAVGSAVAIGIAVRNAIKNAKDKKGDKQANKELDKATQSEIDKLKAQGTTPTLSDADSLALARQIETGLAGCELSGTEKDIVNQIIAKVNNQADWLKLQQQFGVRDIDNCGYGTGDTSYDLKTLLLEQLDGLDWSFTTYSKVLIEGLAKKGITF